MRRGRTRSLCSSSGKVRFRDEVTAKLVLSKLRHRDSSIRTKLERRTYPCASCRGWHLTSMTRSS